VSANDDPEQPRPGGVWSVLLLLGFLALCGLIGLGVRALAHLGTGHARCSTEIGQQE